MSFADRTYRKIASTLLAIALLSGSASTAVQAHLMVAQKGTLNFTNGGAFVVLSLPVSGFDGVDDNADGGLSLSEFKQHQQTIKDAVMDRLTLLDPSGRRPLQGLMVSPTFPEDDIDGSAKQLVVLGRFAVESASKALTLEIGVFGKDLDEQLLNVSVTDATTSRQETLSFSPDKTSHRVFGSLSVE